ncbi:MAG: glycosyltransferase family protein, partial [Burkholderiales bacterium]
MTGAAIPPADLFDCVVMLTWSDWKSEPRSNRYHYATRLARHWPVLFVQPDLADQGAVLEESGSPGIRLLHVSSTYDQRQVEAIAGTLNGLGFRRPLLWIYNPLFETFVAACSSPLKLYHATEAYFARGTRLDSRTLRKLRGVLQRIDLLVSVSDLVNDQYRDRGGYRGDALVLANGCDFEFWSAGAVPAAGDVRARQGKVAFYQGGINRRFDWRLLNRLLAQLPDWEFRFCGRVDGDARAKWKKLERHPNLRYLGELAPEDLRAAAWDADVGLIPFKSTEEMRVSMPLKAFEYVAAGLPVVSTPISALERHPEVFRIARTAKEFASAMQSALAEGRSAQVVQARQSVARGQDYEARLAEFMGWTVRAAGKRSSGIRPHNLLVLYDAHSTHVNTIDEHLRSFSKCSRHNVFYASASQAETVTTDLSLFDVVIIHYCIRVNVPGHLSTVYADALKRYPGLKILFIQDEYDTTENARRAIEDLGISLVYT